MIRYIALAWDSLDVSRTKVAELLTERALQVHADWKVVFSEPGLRVISWCNGTGASTIIPLPDRAGVILGTAFARLDRDTPATRMRFAPQHVRDISANGCRNFPSICWGRYVAFARDPASHISYVLRDPTGGLPCYQTAIRHVEVFFSCTEDVLRLRATPFTLDWDAIAARLVYIYPGARATAVREITEVLPGEQVVLQAGRQTHTEFAWNPLHIASHASADDSESARVEMRRTAKQCIHAWAGCYKAILHLLSGGLDSSIVLGCLRDAPVPPKILCLNYYSAGSDGDERHFARLAAEHAGCELLEWERGTSVRFEKMLELELTPTPGFYPGSMQFTPRQEQLAKEIQAAGRAGGGGGDQLFYQTQAVLAAADYLRLKGATSGFLDVVLDAAHLSSSSVWKVIGQSIRHRFSRSRSQLRDLPVERGLLAKDMVEQMVRTDRYMHPLLQGSSSGALPPGKLWHVFTLLPPQQYYDPFAPRDGCEPIEPLISQPLVELCLRIPTYLLIRGGWDRSIARQAFEGDVPKQILRRRSKGGLEDNAQTIMLQNLEFVRDLLCGGRLLEHGLLQKESLKNALSGEPSSNSATVPEVFECLSVEAWVQRWMSMTSNLTEVPLGSTATPLREETLTTSHQQDALPA